MLKPEKNKMLRRIGIIALVLVLCAIIIGPYALKLTEHPDFCAICHNMKPSVNSYKASYHKGVKCFECHYEPGLIGFIKGEMGIPHEMIAFVTGKYDMKKLDVDIKDASCLREPCHKIERLNNEKFYKRGVVFSHKGHITEEQSCDSCHKADDKVHMKVKAEKACIKCHDLSEPDNDQCFMCHKILPDTENISHSKLQKTGEKCSSCHEGIHVE
ncbi:MAG: NapC/NirT family cytochrome c [bacterium]|nr:NapC/NirT family cytochrome c [bacterium]